MTSFSSTIAIINGPQLTGEGVGEGGRDHIEMYKLIFTNISFKIHSYTRTQIKKKTTITTLNRYELLVKTGETNKNQGSRKR